MLIDVFNEASYLDDKQRVAIAQEIRDNARIIECLKWVLEI